MGDLSSVLMSVSSFTMGDEAATHEDKGAAPEHEVYLDDYNIQVTEVSVKQFVSFLNDVITIFPSGACNGEDCLEVDVSNIEESSYQLGSLFFYSYAAKDNENHPAMGVTVAGAEAYCDHVGMRLCTNAEWEYAARGDGGGRGGRNQRGRRVF